MKIEIHPKSVWRYCVSEVAQLALSQLHLAENLLSKRPGFSSLILGHAMGLSLREVWENESVPGRAIANVWDYYRSDHWSRDLSAFFGTPMVPDTHPCSAVYSQLGVFLPKLRKPKSAEDALAALAVIIKNHGPVLVEFQKKFSTDQSIPVDGIPFDSTLSNLSGKRKFLIDLQPMLEDSTPEVSTAAASLAAKVGLLQFFCCARVSGSIPWEYEFESATENPFEASEIVYRGLARHLFDCLPDDNKREALFHLAAFHPEEEDRRRFLERFEAGDLGPLHWIIKFWPDASTCATIESSLDCGLSASQEELVLPIVPPDDKEQLTTLGIRVDCALAMIDRILPESDALEYLSGYLRLSQVSRLRQTAARSLGEMGGEVAAEALATAVPNTKGYELTVVAEAINKAPSVNGLSELSKLVLDRSRRLDRISVIETLVEHRPDDHLRTQLAEIILEPGCRCGGCVWRKGLRKLTELWPDEKSRGLVEDRLKNEPGYEGKIGAARVLAGSWPDSRTEQLLSESVRFCGISGSGEGEAGHLPYDGGDDASDPCKIELSIRYREKYVDAVEELLETLRGEENPDDGTDQKQVGMILKIFQAKQSNRLN